jgi:DNA modification methylase
MRDVKFGDVWKMGQHRLLCGDSTAKPMIDSFLAGANPKVCITDPPYGIHYSSRRTNNGLYQLKVKNDHAISWGDAFRSSQSPVLYVWFSFKHYDVVSRAVQDAGYEVKQMVVWKKRHFSLQHHLYHLQHEQCLVCIKQGVPTKDLWTGDRKQVSVWDVASVKAKDRIHPTEKPTGVYSIPICNHTNEGDSVLDLFAGSGAVFEACEEQRRVGLGVELCPNACARILTRMESLGCEVALEGNLFDCI